MKTCKFERLQNGAFKPQGHATQGEIIFLQLQLVKTN